jgi:RNA recognition motif-containing protein
MRDPQTKESRGFGFVTFKEVEAATQCTQALNQTDLKGKTMRIELVRFLG